MPYEADLTTSKGDVSIKVGSTGTVGVLMSRELDSTPKNSAQAKTSTPLSSTNRRKMQSVPPKVPCGGTKVLNKKMERSKTMPVKEKPRLANLRKDSQIPILHSNDIITERSASSIDKPKKKGQNCNFVEVVDLTCGGNRMSSQLRKLGFSKLSESFS